MINVIMIAAVASKGVIGKDNKLPWRIPEDLRHFSDMTTGNIVIMGRKTFESLGEKPLPNRINIVISSKYPNGSLKYFENTKHLLRKQFVAFFQNLHEAIEYCHTLTAITKRDVPVYIIGGRRLYEAGLDFASKIILTEIQREYDGDTFFPEMDKNWWYSVNTQPGFSENENVQFNIVTYIHRTRNQVLKL